MEKISFTSSKKVSIIGTGKMGLAISEILLSNGIETTVWNRTTEKVKKLVARGAIPADHSPSEKYFDYYLLV